jgi:hypothetical protein
MTEEEKAATRRTAMEGISAALSEMAELAKQAGLPVLVAFVSDGEVDEFVIAGNSALTIAGGPRASPMSSTGSGTGGTRSARPASLPCPPPG